MLWSNNALVLLHAARVTSLFSWVARAPRRMATTVGRLQLNRHCAGVVYDEECYDTR